MSAIPCSWTVGQAFPGSSVTGIESDMALDKPAFCMTTSIRSILTKVTVALYRLQCVRWMGTPSSS
jgi:hypothetical protein